MQRLSQFVASKQFANYFAYLPEKSSYYKTNLGMNQPKKRKIRNVCRDRQPPHDFHMFCNVDQNVNCQKI